MSLETPFELTDRRVRVQSPGDDSVELSLQQIQSMHQPQLLASRERHTNPKLARELCNLVRLLVELVLPRDHGSDECRRLTLRRRKRPELIHGRCELRLGFLRESTRVSLRRHRRGGEERTYALEVLDMGEVGGLLLVELLVESLELVVDLVDLAVDLPAPRL